MTAEQSVSMTARAPCCGALLTWTGTVAPIGGGTVYRIPACPCTTPTTTPTGRTT